MIKNIFGAKSNDSRGMTLVELMVSIAVTAVVMGLSLSFFLGQYQSYRQRKGAVEITQAAPAALEILKTDLMQAGWGVHPQMAFYIEDGGGSKPDRIFINDISLVDVNRVDLLVGDDCPGCAQILGINGKDVTVSTLDISGEGVGDEEGEKGDFRQGVSMYVITDAVSGNKIAKVDGVNAPQKTLTLSEVVQGDFVAPVIRYASAAVEGVWALRRNDRYTSGLQPLMENVVDLQVAYSTDSGETWFCDGGDENNEGSNGCPVEAVTVRGTSKGDLSPEEINMLRVTLVTRSSSRDFSRINDPNYCRPAVENRSRAALGSNECGYHYRTHTRVIRPRNFGRQ